MVHGGMHLTVNAAAGSDKSTTCIEGARLVRSNREASVLYLAFNKHIQQEMESRAVGWLEALTFHSLGLRAITSRVGAVQIDDKRMRKVIEKLKKWPPGEPCLMGGLKQLSGVAVATHTLPHESIPTLSPPITGLRQMQKKRNCGASVAST
jgi:hypothetical protein